MDGFAVRFAVFFGDHGGYCFVAAVFYLTDSFVILSFLLLFILPVALGNGAVLVGAE